MELNRIPCIKISTVPSVCVSPAFFHVINLHGIPLSELFHMDPLCVKAVPYFPRYYGVCLVSSRSEQRGFAASGTSPNVGEEQNPFSHLVTTFLHSTEARTFSWDTAGCVQLLSCVSPVRRHSRDLEVLQRDCLDGTSPWDWIPAPRLMHRVALGRMLDFILRCKAGGDHVTS